MPSEPGGPEPPEVVVFDMDRTLILQDSLWAQMRSLARRAPFRLLAEVLKGTLLGRALFKQRIHRAIEEADPEGRWLEGIEANPWTLAEVRRWESRSLPVIVATAAYLKTAEKVLDRVGVKPRALLATTGNDNLKGLRKLAALKPHVEGRRWAYYGDSASDRPLFSAADRFWVVGPEGPREGG